MGAMLLSGGRGSDNPRNSGSSLQLAPKLKCTLGLLWLHKEKNVSIIFVKIVKLTGLGWRIRLKGVELTGRARLVK